MSKFQVEAILEGVTPLKDGGVSLRFHTNEVNKADKVMLMEYYQSFGWLLFSANEHQEADVPRAVAKRDTGQPPSQRMRSVIFVYWTQKGQEGDFEAFYNQQMEKLITIVKSNLS